MVPNRAQQLQSLLLLTKRLEIQSVFTYDNFFSARAGDKYDGPARARIMVDLIRGKNTY